MNRYNPDIHHRKSIRLKGYDYSKAGLYFITICTHNRECLFGKIVDGEMILSEIGKMADACWLDIPNHFPNAVLHEYIVMPNHVHGIIELTVGAENGRAENFLPQRVVPRSIPSIIKGFKIGVTKWVRANNNDAGQDMVFSAPPVVWQRNYYEHVIRTQWAYLQISRYIINNPKNWKGRD